MDLNTKAKNELTDEELCCEAAYGDRTAEEILVIRYMRFVRACARPYFLAGGDSEDLLQEGMFGLLSAIREYNCEKDATFRTFAGVCVRNRIRSAVAAAARDKHAPLNNSVPMEGQPLPEQDLTDPEQLFINQEEELERLQSLNQKLSPLEQRILSLYLRGFSYLEIGKQVGRTDKSVDNAVQRIRRKAAEHFGVFSKS